MKFDAVYYEPAILTTLWAAAQGGIQGPAVDSH